MIRQNLPSPNLGTSSITRRSLIGVSAAFCASCVVPEKVVQSKNATPIAQVPFRFDYGRRLTVQVAVNSGESHDFIIDTAATQSVIFDNLAKKMKLAAQATGSAQVYGLSGIKTVPTIDVGTLRLGEVEFNAANAPLLNDWPEVSRTPQGIIGLDLLSSYVVVFRFQDSILELYEANARPKGNWLSEPLYSSNFGVANRPLYFVNIDFGSSRRVPFLLDTGSFDTVCNFAAADYLRAVPALARDPQERDKVVDIHGEQLTAYSLRAAQFAIGTIQLAANDITVMNAPFFRDLGYGDRPFGVLGLTSLVRRDIAIDFTAREISFRSTPP